MPVVVSEYVVDAAAGLQTAERFGYPIEARLAFDDVAGNGDEIGLQSVCFFDDLFEIPARDAAGHVEVGEMGDSQRLVGMRKPRNRDRFFLNAHAQHFVAGQAAEPGGNAW